MGRLVDGNYKVELHRVTPKTFNFFGREVSVKVVDPEAYTSEIVSVTNDKVGDVEIFNNPMAKIDLSLNVFFRGTTAWGDVITGVRQKTDGDLSWF